MENLTVALLASSVFKEILEDMADRADREDHQAVEATAIEIVFVLNLHQHQLLQDPEFKKKRKNNLKQIKQQELKIF